jgi:hypothetical protein
LPPFYLNNPTQPEFISILHSVWVDGTISPPTMWMLQEDASTNIDATDISNINYGNSPPSPLTYRPNTQAQTFNVPALIPNPNAPNPPPPPSAVHHLRAEAKVGFFAHYMDGVDLVDLSRPADGFTSGNRLIASFDTTTLTSAAGSVPGSLFYEKYLGVWDVAPNQDSGFVCCSAGREAGFVFQVTHCQLNRYWRATPFTAGTLQPAGLHPKIVAPYSAPRAGTQLVVRDGNRGRYTADSVFAWTLHLNRGIPTHSLDPNRANIEMNVDVTFPGTVTINNQVGDDVFSISLPDEIGQVWYMQMVVEEYRKLPGGILEELGVFAASRGTWFGVAP